MLVFANVLQGVARTTSRVARSMWSEIARLLCNLLGHWIEIVGKNFSIVWCVHDFSLVRSFFPACPSKGCRVSSHSYGFPRSPRSWMADTSGRQNICRQGAEARKLQIKDSRSSLVKKKRDANEWTATGRLCVRVYDGTETARATLLSPCAALLRSRFRLKNTRGEKKNVEEKSNGLHCDNARV